MRKSALFFTFLLSLFACSNQTGSGEEPKYLTGDELVPFCGTYVLFSGKNASYGEESLYLNLTKNGSYSIRYSGNTFEGTYKLWEETEYPISFAHAVGWYEKKESRPIHGIWFSVCPSAWGLPSPADSAFRRGDHKGIYLLNYTNGQTNNGYDMWIEQLCTSVLREDGVNVDPSLYLGKVS